MGKEKDTKINHTVYNIEDVGQVQIADEVVAVIAGLAATEVEGVAKEVQDKVKSAIETMTGLTVSEVNIRIAGIQMDYE